jgi:hypothetical protein
VTSQPGILVPEQPPLERVQLIAVGRLCRHGGVLSLAAGELDAGAVGALGALTGWVARSSHPVAMSRI